MRGQACSVRHLARQHRRCPEKGTGQAAFHRTRAAFEVSDPAGQVGPAQVELAEAVPRQITHRPPDQQVMGVQLSSRCRADTHVVGGRVPVFQNDNRGAGSLCRGRGPDPRLPRVGLCKGRQQGVMIPAIAPCPLLRAVQRQKPGVAPVIERLV